MKRLVVLSCVVLLSVLGEAVLGVRDPYTQIEGESFDVSQGAKITDKSGVSGGKHASSLLPANHIGFTQLNFSVETAAFQMQFWNEFDYILESQVLLRLDSPTSTPFLTLVTPQGGKRWIHSTWLIPVEQRPRGVHDLYFTFKYPKASIDVLWIDWFQFVTLDSLLPPSHTQGPQDNKCGKCPEENNVNPGGQSHTHWTTDHCRSPDGKHIVINIC